MEKINNIYDLFDVFKREGYELWFVGGFVRDTIAGLEPKDIDLSTSADPYEQINLYRKYDLKYFVTGLEHGTITVVIDEPYEITTFRADREPDGRHAIVDFGVDQDLLEEFLKLGFRTDTDYDIESLSGALKKIRNTK